MASGYLHCEAAIRGRLGAHTSYILKVVRCIYEEVSMTKTLIDLDDVMLERAMQLSGLPTKRAVVATALESYVRRMELDRYTVFVTGGALEDLADASVIEDAQR